MTDDTQDDLETTVEPRVVVPIRTSKRYPAHPVAAMFPMPNDEQLKELAEDIARNGLLEPLVRYADPSLGPVLLDGRSRTAACQLAGVTPRYEHYSGDDPVGFIISKNLRRRQLTQGQRAALAFDLQPYFAEQAKERQREGARHNAARPRDERGRLQVVERLPPAGSGTDKRKSRDDAGSVVGVSGRSVSAYGQLAAEAPDLANQVKAGTLPLHRAVRTVRDSKAARRRGSPLPTRPLATEPKVDIRVGDFQEVLADLRDIDCILTDASEDTERLAEIAAWAERALRPDGVLAVLVTQSHLLDSLKLLDGHRPYRWTVCCLMPWTGSDVAAQRVKSKWKPLVVYGGGPKLPDDVIGWEELSASKAMEPHAHKINVFGAVVERLSQPGHVVCDPMPGEGTTLVAAHTVGRNVISCVPEAQVAKVIDLHMTLERKRSKGR
jgi:hypothetical protein